MIVTYTTGFRGSETNTIVIEDTLEKDHNKLLSYIKEQCRLEYNSRQRSDYRLSDLDALQILMIYKD